MARKLAPQTAASEYDAVAERYERLVAPRFAVVAARLANIAALRPGERVHFTRVSLAEAQRLHAAKSAEISEWVTRLRTSLEEG